MSNTQLEATPSPAPRHDGNVVQFIPRLSREPMKVRLIEGDGLSSTARVATYWMLDAALSSVAPRGTKKCRKAVHAADEIGAKSATKGSSTDELRQLLRVRCGNCLRRCKAPLV